MVQIDTAFDTQVKGAIKLNGSNEIISSAKDLFQSILQHGLNE